MVISVDGGEAIVRFDAELTRGYLVGDLEVCGGGARSRTPVPDLPPSRAGVPDAAPSSERPGSSSISSGASAAPEARSIAPAFGARIPTRPLLVAFGVGASVGVSATAPVPASSGGAAPVAAAGFVAQSPFGRGHLGGRMPQAGMAPAVAPGAPTASATDAQPRHLAVAAAGPVAESPFGGGPLGARMSRPVGSVHVGPPSAPPTTSVPEVLDPDRVGDEGFSERTVIRGFGPGRAWLPPDLNGIPRDGYRGRDVLLSRPSVHEPPSRESHSRSIDDDGRTLYALSGGAPATVTTAADAETDAVAGVARGGWTYGAEAFNRLAAAAASEAVAQCVATGAAGGARLHELLSSETGSFGAVSRGVSGSGLVVDSQIYVNWHDSCFCRRALSCIPHASLNADVRHSPWSWWR